MATFSASSSSRNPVSIPSPSADSGFIEMCRCGGELKLKSERTGPDIGRLYYRCSNHEESGEHTIKWWDTAVGQEIANNWKTIITHDEKLKKLSSKLKNVAKSGDPTALRMKIAKMEKLINVLLEDVAELSKKQNNAPKHLLNPVHKAYTSIKRRINTLTNQNTRFWSYCFGCSLAISIMANVYFLYA